jgi:UDP-N-acetylglucosamine/UDP-N-acetyl-alpha-D-glucosaminouronate 4-epimerase
MALYVITGAAGFIGSALVRAVVAQGDQVVGVDNLSTGRRENLAAVLDRIDFREVDINDAGKMSAACRGADYVLHQAAIASVPRSVREPEVSNRANVDGTLAVLMAARGAGVKRLVYAASSSAYGDNPALPKQEDMLPAPISPYAVAKLAGEHYVRSFWRCYGMETVALRYFNIFGPRQDPTSQYSAVFAKFIAAMLAGEQPTIFGDGEQSRDFTYIDNCVRANLLACAAPAEKCAGRVFNVAIGERHSVREVFELAKRHTGYPGAPAFAPARTGDVKHSQADIRAIREALGYQPLVGFEEGVKRTVDWYRAETRTAKA